MPVSTKPSANNCRNYAYAVKSMTTKEGINWGYITIAYGGGKGVVDVYHV
jgi:hypothetical protein